MLNDLTILIARSVLLAIAIVERTVRYFHESYCLLLHQHADSDHSCSATWPQSNGRLSQGEPWPGPGGKASEWAIAVWEPQCTYRQLPLTSCQSWNDVLYGKRRRLTMETNRTNGDHINVKNKRPPPPPLQHAQRQPLNGRLGDRATEAEARPEWKQILAVKTDNRNKMRIS